MSKEKAEFGGDLALAVLGPTPEEDAWTSDLRVRMPLLWLEADAASMVRLEVQRARRLVERAASGLDALAAYAERRPEAFRRELRPLSRLLESAKSFGLVGASDPVSETLWELSEARVESIRADRAELRREIAGAARVVEASSAHLLRQAFELVREGLAETGSERLIQLRDARRALAELQMETGGDCPGAALLCHGWLVWSGNQAASEARGLLDEAVRRAGDAPALSAHLALRLLAAIFSAFEEHRDAARYSSLAVQVHASGPALVEACAYAAARGERTEALRFASLALDADPSSLLDLLADGRVAKLGGELLDLIVRAQWRARHEAAVQVDRWIGSARRVAEAEREAGLELRLPESLTPGGVEANAGQADLLSAGYWASRAKQTQKELVRIAISALQREHAERTSRAAACRRAVDECADRRDARIAAAQRRQNDTARRARWDLAHSDEESERAQRGCVFGLGGGCGLFGLYVTTAALLAGRGISIGLGTPFGMATLAVATAPVVVAALLQVAHGLRRMALETQVHRRIASADETYEQSVNEAERAYVEEVVRFREALAEAERERDRIATALQGLAQATARAA